MTVIRDDTVQEKLLQTENLKLEQCVTICRLSAITTNQLGQMSVKPVHAVKQKQSRSAKSSTKQYSRNDKQYGLTQSQESTFNTSKCNRCGGLPHQNFRKCPAYGAKCNQCGKMNHYSRVCKSKHKRHVHDIGIDNDDNPGVQRVIHMCHYPESEHR